VLDFIPKGQRLDLPDLVRQLVAAGEVINCYPYNGYWLDIGRPDDYAQAAEDFEKLAAQLVPPE
jgi:NDP-sugar pyrophosphorylase family protein